MGYDKKNGMKKLEGVSEGNVTANILHCYRIGITMTFLPHELVNSYLDVPLSYV